MFYRLWEAVKRRPTRSLGIASVVLISGAVAHAFLTLFAFVKTLTAPTTLGSVYEGSVSRSATIANAAVWLDIVTLFAGLSLGIACLWRIWRSLE
jgi:hypothetical protein